MDKKMCSGCGACKNICPFDCITMIEDKNGYIYPVKDKKKCTGCNLCKKVCPFIDAQLQKKDVENCYELVYNNEKIIKESSSGGAFSAIVQAFVGICHTEYSIYACTMNNKLEVYHTGINNISEISIFRKSKYIQSDMRNVHKLIKNDLTSGKSVIFVGTPCQVSSVKKFLINNDNNKLVLVDIICHGVPNGKIFKKYIHDFEKKSKSKVLEYSFREKAKIGNVVDLSAIKMKIRNKRGKIENVIKYCFEDYYMRAFYANLLFRESCYNCPYACGQRCSDITIGDFWGKQKDKNGISLVTGNSAMGIKIIENAKKYAAIENADYEEARKYNKNLNHPTEKNRKQTEFMQDLNNDDFETVVNRYTKKKSKISYIISKNLNDDIKDKIKNMLGE